jgi:Di-haem oxidoreductase, putative peroxidase
MGASAFRLALAALALAPLTATSADSVPTHQLYARVVAVGLHGPAGVRQVGMFHAGGPIPGNPEFLMQTRPGRILEAERVLVASSSNFGAPPADPKQASGSILSIDTKGVAPIVVPERFAAAGGQAGAANGAVRLYTAQSPEFLNRAHNRDAVTAALGAASGPRYISINNAFGRPWLANAPFGVDGAGSSTVVDPSGQPLDNAPSSGAGGVFAGALTNRTQATIAQPSGLIAKALNYRPSGQLTPGDLSHGALGTAFLGPSPDGSGLAVFAVATADGAIVQVHVQDGVDGLAPPGTFTPAATGGDPAIVGIAFKWTPDRTLYVVDCGRNRLAVLHLTDDARQFKVARVSYLSAPALLQPVDVAAALPEVANPRFASHTTLAGGSDLYVANRGDGSLVRIDQDGRILARAEIRIPGLGPVGPDRIRALAVSADAQRIWLTLQGELPGFAGHDGALVEVSAFDANGPFRRTELHAGADVDMKLVRTGEAAFHRELGPKDGLGPLFNARSCLACHNAPTAGGTSAREENFAVRVARAHPVTGRLEALADANTPVARRHSVRELGDRDAPPAGIPRAANVTSLRMPPALYEVGLFDRIPDAAILAHAVSKGDGIKGRPNQVVTAGGERRIGRYGWKADIATLDDMVASAYANELGVATPLAPLPGQPIEDDGGLVRAVVAYLRALRAPPR